MVFGIQDRLSGFASTLMQPPPGMAFDFSQPRGEPGLVAADSISWRIFKNPVTLFIGGVVAVILELAEPSVRSGVWDHSTFQKDALMRLRRTGAAAMMTVYGPRSAAEQMIARVVKVHDRVRGTTPEGIAYHANDQRLLDWVQATASFGFIEAYSAYAAPMTDWQKSQAFAEGAEAARLYGAIGAPRSLDNWLAMRATMEPSLVRSPIISDFLGIMRKTKIAPGPLRPVQTLLVRAAVDIVPAPIKTKLGLDDEGLSKLQRAVVGAMARAADKVPLRDAPPAQSSIRLGLSADYLYR